MLVLDVEEEAGAEVMAASGAKGSESSAYGHTSPERSLWHSPECSNELHIPPRLPQSNTRAAKMQMGKQLADCSAWPVVTDEPCCSPD